MNPGFRGAVSRLAARVADPGFAKPAARVAFVAAGLACLALIGNAAVAGSPALPAAPAPAAVSATRAGEALVPASPAAPTSAVPASSGASSEIPRPARGHASTDDPVILNSAGVDGLRRLPGIGEKRANAILALRARLVRFRAVEDLLKVKGIGRAMLKRLRPLVQLDAKPPPDAGVTEVAR